MNEPPFRVVSSLQNAALTGKSASQAAGEIDVDQKIWSRVESCLNTLDLHSLMLLIGRSGARCMGPAVVLRVRCSRSENDNGKLQEVREVLDSYLSAHRTAIRFSRGLSLTSQSSDEADLETRLNELAEVVSHRPDGYDSVLEAYKSRVAGTPAMQTERVFYESLKASLKASEISLDCMSSVASARGDWASVADQTRAAAKQIVGLSVDACRSQGAMARKAALESAGADAEKLSDWNRKHASGALGEPPDPTVLNGLWTKPQPWYTSELRRLTMADESGEEWSAATVEAAQLSNLSDQEDVETSAVLTNYNVVTSFAAVAKCYLPYSQTRVMTFSFGTALLGFFLGCFPVVDAPLVGLILGFTVGLVYSGREHRDRFAFMEDPTIRLRYTNVEDPAIRIGYANLALLSSSGSGAGEKGGAGREQPNTVSDSRETRSKHPR